ncbi:MAG TPA: hypothetical protein VLS86_05980, partial [Acidimicrobiia bacterium]|nr:hypothetical protein [Acidimicrobiia bacterium]
YANLEVIDRIQPDSTAGAWLNGLLCVGAGGDPTLAIKTLSGVEHSSLVLYTEGDSEVLAEDVERLLDTAAGPVVIGSDGVIYAIDVDNRTLTPLTESVGDLRGQLVAAVSSPDGTHIALTTLDWDQYPLDGRVIVIDLKQGTNAQLGVACDIYPIWLDDETLTFTDHCTSEVPGFYDTNLEAVAGNPIPDYAHTSYVTDETHTIFYPSEFAIRALEPGMEDSVELTRLFTYPGALLLMPPSARTEWVQPAFDPAPIVDVPPVTFVEAPAPGVPGADPVDAETPIWLLIVVAIAAGGGLWMLLRRPGETPASEVWRETL